MTHPAIALLPGNRQDRGMRHLPQLLLVAAIASASAADDYDEGGRAGWGAFAVHPTLADLAANDLVPGQGLAVVFVRPGGTADTLGIKPGDVVLAINGTPVSSRQEVRAIVRAAEAGDAVRVTVRDGGGTAVRSGAFQARQPRPPGPPPWAWGMPPPNLGEILADRDPATQREQLLAERAALDAAAAELAALPKPARSPSAAWYVHLEIR